MNPHTNIKANPCDDARTRIRAFPWQSYTLPSDGRKARYLGKERRALAIELASFGNADGTSITAGRKKLGSDLGWPIRTVGRRISELEEIGPGLLLNDGLTKEHGTARRKLDISKLKMPLAGRPDSESERPDSVEQEGQIHIAGRPDRTGAGVQEGQIHIAGRPDRTGAGVQEGQIRIAGRPDTIGPQPVLPEKQTNLTNLPEWVGSVFFDENQKHCKHRPIDTAAILAAIENNSEGIVRRAWEQFVSGHDYNAETKYPSYLFVKTLGDNLKRARADLETEINREARQKASCEAAAIVLQQEAAETLRKRAEWRKREDEGPTLDDIMAD